MLKCAQMPRRPPASGPGVPRPAPGRAPWEAAPRSRPGGRHARPSVVARGPRQGRRPTLAGRGGSEGRARRRPPPRGASPGRCWGPPRAPSRGHPEEGGAGVCGAWPPCPGPGRGGERRLALRPTGRLCGRPMFPMLGEAVACLCNGETPALNWLPHHASLSGCSTP